MKLHVSESSSVHHLEFFTVHTAMLYVIQVYWQLGSRIRILHPDPACYGEKILMMDRGTVQNM